MSSTNAMESANPDLMGFIRRLYDFKYGLMMLRYTAAGFLEAACGFRQIKDIRQTPCPVIRTDPLDNNGRLVYTRIWMSRGFRSPLSFSRFFKFHDHRGNLPFWRSVRSAIQALLDPSLEKFSAAVDISEFILCETNNEYDGVASNVEGEYHENNYRYRLKL